MEHATAWGYELQIFLGYESYTESKLEFSRIWSSLLEPHLANLTHNKCVEIPQWPTLDMVEALVCGLEGGGDIGG